MAQRTAPQYLLDARCSRGTLRTRAGLELVRYTWLPGAAISGAAAAGAAASGASAASTASSAAAVHQEPAAAQQAPRGVVLLIHGIGTHCTYEWLRHTSFPHATSYEGCTLHEPRYEGSWVERLNALGLVVTGIDQQGHGLSPSSRPGLPHFFERFQELVADQAELQAAVRAEHPAAPVFVLAASLGGCVAAHLLALPHVEVAGAVLLAPMLSVEQLKAHRVNRMLLPVASLASALLPTARLARKLPHVNAAMGEHFRADPLNDAEDKVRCRVAYECLRAAEAARSLAPRVRAPLLVFHSLYDTMVDVAGSEFFVNESSAEPREFVRVDCKDAWHALHNEPGNQQLLDRTVLWIEERLATLSTQSRAAPSTPPASTPPVPPALAAT